jgi:hypothetical protein
VKSKQISPNNKVIPMVFTVFNILVFYFLKWEQAAITQVRPSIFFRQQMLENCSIFYPNRKKGGE